MINRATNLRIGGLHSGLDTDAIVRAMSASTRLRINNNKRKVLRLEAQQVAYRDVISKMQNFQRKYFDQLNRNTFLKSATIFNQHKASVFNSDGEMKTPSGVTVTSGTNASPGSYDVTLIQKATQATLQGTAFGSDVKMDLEKLTDNGHGSYAFSIRVGDTAKNIMVEFEAGDTEVDAVNRALKKAFGEDNLGGGLVYINDEGNVFSADRRAISVSDFIRAESLVDLGEIGSNLKAGNNSISIQIGDELRLFRFDSQEASYFSILFEAPLTNDRDANIKAIAQDRYDAALALALDEAQNDPEIMEKALERAYALAIRNKFIDEDVTLEEWVDDIGEEEAFKYGYANNVTTSLFWETETVKASYEPAFAAFERAVLTRYNDMVRPEFEEWKESVDYETEKDVVFEAAYQKRLAEQQATTIERLFKANPDNGYDTFEEALEAFRDGELTGKLAEEAAKLTWLTKTAFRNGAYNEFEAFKEFSHLTNSELDVKFDDFRSDFDTAEKIAELYNQQSLKIALESENWNNKEKLHVSFDSNGIASVTTSGGEDLAISFNKGSANEFGVVEKTEVKTASVSNTTTLAALDGIAFDSNGRASITVNGTTINLTSTMTVAEMVRDVTNSAAGVVMSFSALTNSFTLTSKEYGTGANITVTGTDGVVATLGLGGTVERGKNLEIEINKEKVQTTSNSFTIDGTTITFANHVEENVKFTIEVGSDKSQAAAAIKSFVEDYNKLIEDVFGYVSDKPNKSYHFLTDDDIDDMQLSDRQIEQWEAASKKGLLYNDSAITGIMSKLRTAMYTSVKGINGKDFGIYNIRGNDGTIAIKATSDYKKNGMLEFDENALIEALERNPDDIIKLFTDPQNGLMKKLEDVLDSAVKTTGAKENQGILIQRAGTATGLSSMNNSIFDQIKNLNRMIDTLQVRYDKQQDRYWNIFTAMEKQFASMNSQSSYITNMFGGMQ
ncbi:MAG: flagellar filament capping protein FliD [Oscillospiraceae bacterium]|nr:flagellar filament capping protein FliD [Oscillospiraceae bacterium]